MSATRTESPTLAAVIDRLCRGESLNQAGSRDVFGRLMRGELSDVELTALLIALRSKGESPDEIAGAAQAMREAAMPFPVDGIQVVDTCGTGGDGTGTVNISTATALVVAEAGLKVVKHGNRSISSHCGSADLLEAVGVRIEAPPIVSRRCLDLVDICFLFAPQYHPGMRHAMPVRRALGVRTMFNLLGPLANPAAPAFQMVGVYHPDLCPVLAETLGRLGCRGALVVHGGGLDEVAIHSETTAAIWRDGGVQTLTIRPEDAGVQCWPIEALQGGTVSENATWFKRLLSGEASPAHRQAVALNAGVVLWLTGASPDIPAGVGRALQLLDSGNILQRLARWAELSHGA